MPDLSDLREALEDIRRDMIEKIEEAQEIVRQLPGPIRARAESYWLAQIKVALMKEHGYLAGSMCDMEDTIEEIRDREEPESDDDDDE